MQSSGRFCVDIEADGLNPTRIWCIVAIDYDTFEEFYFKEETLNDFISFSTRINCYIGHNFIGYDLFVLNKLLLLGIKLRDIVDTVVLSRLFNPVRVGGHSLENFGKLFNSPKLEHEDWSKYSEEMLQRCIQDTRLTVRLYSLLLNEGKGFSERSIRLEHATQYILEEQKRHGFFIDVQKALAIRIECLSKMSEIEQDIEVSFKPQPKPIRLVHPKIKKDNTLSVVGLKGFNLNEVEGDFTLIDYEKFNLSSPTQVVKRMERYGWKPTVFNKPTTQMSARGQIQGSPSICEENINTLPDTAPKSAKNIGTYLMCKSRANLVDQWFKALGNDNRIHGTVFSTGAITHRCGHINPNMANIPSLDPEGKKGLEGRFGYECREVFTVEDKENRRLVGVDAKAIQLRVLAHYVNDSDYIDAVVNGDPHSYNQQAAGLDTRARAKTFIYAFLLGAGDYKLGKIVEGTTADGKALRERFLSNMPGLKKLRLQCEEDARRGYMIGLDGRCIPIKSAHFALSSYLQGGEAVIMKAAYVESYNRFKREKLDAMTVAFVHDEFQTECHKDITERVGNIHIEAIRNTTKLFNLNCPMDGEARVGLTWAECH